MCGDIISNVYTFVNKSTYLYNLFMKLIAREIIKIFLSRTGVKQKDLAVMLSECIGKKYTPGSLSQKINRGTITYNEVIEIADLLGYEIKFEQKVNA